LVIDDHLPSGLIPVNTNLKNEQTRENKNSQELNNEYQYGVNREFTKDGVILSIEDLPSGSHSFTYQARVVSQGKFNVIPAIISKMYSPNVYGRTASETVEVLKEKKENVAVKIANNKIMVYVVMSVIAIVLISAGGYYLWRKKYSIMQ